MESQDLEDFDGADWKPAPCGGRNRTGAGPGRGPNFDVPYLFDGRPEPHPKFDVLSPSAVEFL